MYTEKIEEILSLNGIDQQSFNQKVYQTLILGVFEVVCKEMKKQNARIIEKENFRKHKNKAIAAKLIVQRYTGCQLPGDAYIFMADLLSAYFRTGAPRKTFDDSFRKDLTSKQKFQCAICKRRITSSSGHVDHIIPWDYVGDNLKDNYQMLCETCNERKGTAAYFELSMLLLNKSNTNKT